MLHSTFSSRCKPPFKNAMKFIAACALPIMVSGTIYAQTPDAKRALAVRAIAAQEGPEMQQETRISTDKMYNNVMTKFVWGGMDNKDILHVVPHYPLLHKHIPNLFRKVPVQGKLSGFVMR